MDPNSKTQAVISDKALVENLKIDINHAKSLTDQTAKIHKLQDIFTVCLSAKEWDLAMEAVKYIQDDKVRNFLIARLIEEHLIPAHQIKLAEEYSRFMVPQSESAILIQIRLSLLENDREEALGLVNQLPTPISRNYALWRIAESFIFQGNFQKVFEIGKLMIENARLLTDSEQQSYELRDIAKNLFLAYGHIELANEAAKHISDPAIKTRVLQIIQCCS